MNSAIFGFANPASTALSSSIGRGSTGPSRFARASAISSAYAGTTMAEALMQQRPPFSEIDVHHEIEILGPALDLIRADQNLAVAGAVDLDPRIAGIPIGGGLVAENQRASAEPQHLAGAFVIRRVKTKRFRRHARRDEAWISRHGVHGSSRPGLMTTGILSAIAGSQSEFTAGELLGMTTPSELVVAK